MGLGAPGDDDATIIRWFEPKPSQPVDDAEPEAPSWPKLKSIAMIEAAGDSAGKSRWNCCCLLPDLAGERTDNGDDVGARTC